MQVSGQRALAGGEEPTLVTTCVNEFCITIELKLMPILMQREVGGRCFIVKDKEWQLI